MKDTAWFKGFPGAVTVTDAQGVIVAMNEQSAKVFEEDGGYALIGKNVLDCHPEPARSKLEELFNSPRKERLCHSEARKETVGLPGTILHRRPIRRFG